jgi:hypothetical protein
MATRGDCQEIQIGRIKKTESFSGRKNKEFQTESQSADVVQDDLLDIASVRAALSGVRRASFIYRVKDGPTIRICSCRAGDSSELRLTSPPSISRTGLLSDR